MLPLLFHLFLLKLFPVLQGKLVKLTQENQDEQKLLRETIDKLQKQLTDKEQELAARESALRRQQDKVEENRRKFELEKEVTLERLREDRLRFQVQFFFKYTSLILLILLREKPESLRIIISHVILRNICTYLLTFSIRSRDKVVKIAPKIFVYRAWQLFQ